jgi:hypothetical protein
VSTRIPTLVHAETRQNFGGVFVEEQLEMVRRVVGVHGSDSYPFVAAGAQFG